jgi:xylulose-5-phosphate/fructose-6-phosphate phosphoketolase
MLTFTANRAWHANKYIDPNESGAVLPILHLNGFKISERTISGCMDDRELSCLFSGYGYQPCFVEDLENIDADLNAALNWAVTEIQSIQRAARTGHPITKPRWPMIVLRTPKGWGCPKKMHGEWIEGSFRAHQVPLPNAKSDSTELGALQDWLLSYGPKELFPSGHLCETAQQILPQHKYKRLGQNPIYWHGRKDLNVPEWKDYALRKDSEASCLKSAGTYLNQALYSNKHSLRIFSPDELVSNKLDAVFEHTSRNFQWDQYSRGRGGQVIEILSEHTCQGKFPLNCQRNSD